MEKDIESILGISCYLSLSKDNIKKTELGRDYLSFKVNSLLSRSISKNKSTHIRTSIFSIPLFLLSL